MVIVYYSNGINLDNVLSRVREICYISTSLLGHDLCDHLQHNIDTLGLLYLPLFLSSKCVLFRLQRFSNHLLSSISLDCHIVTGNFNQNSTSKAVVEKRVSQWPNILGWACLFTENEPLELCWWTFCSWSRKNVPAWNATMFLSPGRFNDEIASTASSIFRWATAERVWWEWPLGMIYMASCETLLSMRLGCVVIRFIWTKYCETSFRLQITLPLHVSPHFS